MAPATEESDTDMVVDILQDTWLLNGCEKVFRRTNAELFCPVGVEHHPPSGCAVGVPCAEDAVPRLGSGASVLAAREGGGKCHQKKLLMPSWDYPSGCQLPHCST